MTATLLEPDLIDRVNAAVAGLSDGAAATFDGLTGRDYQAAMTFRDARHRGRKMLFDRGRLDVVSKTMRHERFARGLARLIAILCETSGVEYVDCGETTVAREDLARGFEPDGWFYVGPSAERMAEKDAVDFRTDPPPDVAIEIELTNSAADKLAVYAAVGVRELWRFDGETLTVNVLARGKYRAGASQFFPTAGVADIATFLASAPTTGNSAWGAKVRAWAERIAGPQD